MKQNSQSVPLLPIALEITEQNSLRAQKVNSFWMKKHRQMCIRNKHLKGILHRTTLKLVWSNPTWTMDSIDSTSAVLHLLLKHNASTPCSKNPLFLWSLPGTLIAEFSVNLVHFCGIIPFLLIVRSPNKSSSTSFKVYSFLLHNSLQSQPAYILNFYFPQSPSFCMNLKATQNSAPLLLVHFYWTHK